MSRHTDRGHEEELARLRAGAGGRTSLAGTPLAGCPACAELIELERRLGDLGAEERAAIAESHAGTATPEGRAERALRERIAADLPPARRGRRGAVLALVGLAAAAAVALLALRDRDGAPDPRLGHDLQALHPVGPVAEFDEFRWTALDGAVAYEVEVRLDPSGEVVARSGRVDGTTWTPSAEDVARWGERIEWTVSAFGASAYQLLDSDIEFAQRSSR